MRTLFSYASYYSTNLKNVVEYREQIKKDMLRDPNTFELFRYDKEIFISEEEETSKGVWTVRSNKTLSEDEINDLLVNISKGKECQIK